MKYIIEHMDKELFEWSLLEYNHISDIVGKENLTFTNVKCDRKSLPSLGKISDKSVINQDLKNSKVCVLDPISNTTLKTEDKNKFDTMIFGGVLGDHPMQLRTKSEISSKLNCETRNLGKIQMSTNTAVYVTKIILEGETLSNIKFKDDLEIKIEEGESVILPYRYVLHNSQPILPPGFLEFIKRNPGFD